MVLERREERKALSTGRRCWLDNMPHPPGGEQTVVDVGFITVR